MADHCTLKIKLILITCTVLTHYKEPPYKERDSL